VRLIRIEILTGLIDLDHLELLLDAIIMEDTLDASPATPFKASPAGLSGSDTGLGKARNVNVSAVYAGMTDSVGVGILGRNGRRGGRVVSRGRRTTSTRGIRGRARPRTTRAALSLAAAADRISFGVGSSLLRGAGGMGVGVGMSHTTAAAASGSATRRLRVPAAVLEDTGGVALLKDTVVFRVLV